MNIKTIINAQGEIIEICVIKKVDGSVVDYKLQDGEQAVDYLNDCRAVTNGISHSPLKPKWNGVKWVEMATDKELQAAYPVQPTPPPTIEERTAATEMAVMALMGGM